MFDLLKILVLIALFCSFAYTLYKKKYGTSAGLGVMILAYILLLNYIKPV